MTKEKARFKVDLKVWRTLLLLLAALLTFGGPTYAMFVLSRTQHSYPYTDPLVSASGFILFFLGILLFLYLFRKESVPEKVSA